MLQACKQLLPGDERSGVRRLLAPREWVRRLRPPAVWKQKRRTYGVARFLGGRLASDDRTAAVRLPAATSPVLRLMHVLEQAPNPESRVVLDDRRDALGMRRVRLEWRMLPLDQHTAGSIRRLVGDAFGRAGLGAFGTLRGDDASEWPPPPLQGMRGHHMGTTRMDPDPKRGVVDPNCRVHGVEDLFVASSSVFPTSGAGTPTVTIVALALRLADHLQRRLQ
jgi:choline dehydrogenase-like flavoprotein